MKRFLLTVSLVAGMLLSAASSAQATFVSYGGAFGFERVSFNHPEDVGPLLHVQLGSDSDLPGYVAFRFNFDSFVFSPDTHPEINGIYMEDGAYSLSQLFANASGSFVSPNPIFDSTQSSPGTDFAAGSPSGALPGADFASPPFLARLGFLAKSSINPNAGINAGEHAVFLVKLNSGVSIDDVFEALHNPVLNGGAGYELRFGLREVNDNGGLADGYVNVNLQVPEPATVGVWAIGMALIGCVTAWRRKKATA